MVGSNSGSQTQNIFRSIKRNTSVFTADLLEDMKMTAQLSVIPPEPTTP